MEPTETRGRQAEARLNDRAVLDAARLVFAVDGAGAPVAAIAAEAGVGMGSLYRRFPSKQALLRHLCTESMAQLAALATAAAAEPDPLTGLRGFVRDCVAARVGAFGATVSGLVDSTEEMRQLARRAHQAMAKLLRSAQESGQVRADVTAVDLQLLIELFSRRRRDDADAHSRLLTIALDGLAAHDSTTPMPVESLDW